MPCVAKALRRLLTTICLSILTICLATSLRAQQVDVRANEIGGVVTGTMAINAGGAQTAGRTGPGLGRPIVLAELRQRGMQVAAGADAKLGVYLAQVPFDRAR